jgi:hypothetical protein
VLHTEIARLDSQSFAHRKERVKNQLLRHHTQQAPGLCVVGLHIVPLHQHTPAGGARQPGQNADQGSFAGTVRAEQAKEFAFFDVKTD